MVINIINGTKMREFSILFNTQSLRRQIIFRDLENPLELDDLELNFNYRLPRNQILKIIDV